ncbi:hypothetical protein B0H17DRAFT_1339595 [Mycena rosella]|uniref:Uncharacterized protein n=1 Tax=Mycena rosella TaxID=1033263 RepID=A0AAD7C2N7_MYCRO|nr:hypothetical protein B0H17DRAFT_1339595 [Mycena rosella]
MCTGQPSPQQMGLLDHRRLHTPPYAYGWIVSYGQLVEAATKIFGCAPQTLQGLFVNARWKTLRHADTYGGALHSRPSTINVQPHSCTLPPTGRGSGSNPPFRKTRSGTCRECSGNPRAVQQDAMWFRVDMDAVPDDYDYKFEDFVGCGHFMGL